MDSEASWPSSRLLCVFNVRCHLQNRRKHFVRVALKFFRSEGFFLLLVSSLLSLIPCSKDPGSASFSASNGFWSGCLVISFPYSSPPSFSPFVIRRIVQYGSEEEKR